MNVTRSRTTRLVVRSDGRFEELDLAAIRQFVAGCDHLGLPDELTVSLQGYGDGMVRLEVTTSRTEKLSPFGPVEEVLPDPLPGEEVGA